MQLLMLIVIQTEHHTIRRNINYKEHTHIKDKPTTKPKIQLKIPNSRTLYKPTEEIFLNLTD